MFPARTILPLLLLAWACHEDAGPSVAPARPTPAEPPLQPRTTSPALAARNLDAMIETARSEVTRHPDRAVPRGRLASLLKARATFFGRLDDWAAFEQLGDAIPDTTTDGEALLVRGRIRLGVHRYKAARADLAAAEQRGARPAQVAEFTAELLEAEGRLREAMAARAAQRETFESLSAQAVTATLLGSFGRAHHFFRRARAALRDASPFPIAWLDVQEGELLRREGRRDDARNRYAEAVRRLPSYPDARLALASVQVDPAEALAILRAHPGVHPEILARLSALQLVTGDAGGARTSRDLARAEWDRLLTLSRSAFAGHAAAFLVQLDPARALELARWDAGERDTIEAYEALRDIALAAGAREEACTAQVRIAAAGPERRLSPAGLACAAAAER